MQIKQHLPTNPFLIYKIIFLNDETTHQKLKIENSFFIIYSFQIGHRLFNFYLN